MDSKKISELRKHLQAALDCLGDSYEDDGEDKAEDPMLGADDSDDDDVADKSLRMKMSKYK